MSKGVLSAVVAFFHKLFGIVPGAAGVGQEDGQHKAGTQAAGQQADYGRRPQQQAHHRGDQDGQQGGKNHLLLGCLGGNAHTAGIVRTLPSFQDARYLVELAADLHHHLGSGAAHGVHGEAAEEEGHHGADENAHQHLGVHQGDVVQIHDIRNAGVHGFHRTVTNLQHRPADMTQPNLQFFNIGGQQGQGRQGGRADGKALSGSGGGVAQGVQYIRLFAHGRVQFAHLGVAAGIVGDGTVGVRGQGDAQGG